MLLECPNYNNLRQQSGAAVYLEAAVAQPAEPIQNNDPCVLRALGFVPELAPPFDGQLDMMTRHARRAIETARLIWQARCRLYSIAQID